MNVKDILKTNIDRKALIVSLIVAFLFWLGLYSALGQNVYPYSDSINTDGWVLNSDVSDEFNENGIDANKWFVLGVNGDYRTHWKGRAPSQYVGKNVRVSDGFLTISSKWEPDFPFADETLNGYKYGDPAPITTGGIIAENYFHYGYIEIRCKIADGPISSAFWTTGNGGELDVFEDYGEKPTNESIGKKHQTSFHDWRNGSETYGQRIWTNEHIFDYKVADDFHVYGFEWDENYIKIFADGSLIRCVTKDEIGDAWVVNNEQRIWLDSETFNWVVNPATLKADDFPGEGRKYIIDYVRVWQKDEASEGCVSRLNLVDNPGFEDGLDAWTISGAAVPVSENVYEGEGAVKLESLGQIEQVVNVKPNTIYVASAQIVLPGTNMSDIWHNALLGVKDYANGFNSVNYFRPEYTYQSVQFTTGNTDHTATVYFKNKQASHVAFADNFKVVEIGTVEPPTKILISYSGEFQVYPNPAKHKITISGIDIAYEYCIYNVQGVKYCSGKISSSTDRIDISTLDAGIYIVNIKGAKLNKSIKFSKTE